MLLTGREYAAILVLDPGNHNGVRHGRVRNSVGGVLWSVTYVLVLVVVICESKDVESRAQRRHRLFGSMDFLFWPVQDDCFIYITQC